MHIELLTSDNLDSLFELFSQVLETEFPEYGSQIIQYTLINDDLWNSKTFEYQLSNSDKFLFLGLFDEEKLVGFLDGGASQYGVGTLHWVMIDAEYQNSQWGSKLLKKYEEYLQKNGGHLVLTHTHERAERFYEKNHYKKIGELSKAWFGLDYLIMSKELIS